MPLATIENQKKPWEIEAAFYKYKRLNANNLPALQQEDLDIITSVLSGPESETIKDDNLKSDISFFLNSLQQTPYFRLVDKTEKKVIYSMYLGKISIAIQSTTDTGQKLLTLSPTSRFRLDKYATEDNRAMVLNLMGYSVFSQFAKNIFIICPQKDPAPLDEITSIMIRCSHKRVEQISTTPLQGGLNIKMQTVGAEEPMSIRVKVVPRTNFYYAIKDLSDTTPSQSKKKKEVEEKVFQRVLSPNPI